MNDKKKLKNYDDLPLVLDVDDVRRIMGISRRHCRIRTMWNTCWIATCPAPKKNGRSLLSPRERR